MKIKVMLLILVLFTGCSTLATYVTNVESDYEIISIKIEQGFFKKYIISIGNYHLQQTKNVSSEISFGDLFSGKTGNKYTFYWNDTVIGGNEIYKKEVGIKSSNDSMILYNIYNNIIIDGLIKEYKILSKKSGENYVVYNDNLIGIVVIKNYYSKNKNAPKNEWDYHTGFEIIIKNESYGILGFYPKPVLFKKNGNKTITKEIEDRLMFYIITSYQTYREME
jgi:hypothetical protein